jgi:hypothetical protein
MIDRTIPGIWILLPLGIASVSPAFADGPRPGFKLDPVGTVFTSPDRKVRVEAFPQASAVAQADHLQQSASRPLRAQNAGIDRRNQYVAARNRFAGLKDAHVRIGPGQEDQEKQL